jgi:hypothetical protein
MGNDIRYDGRVAIVTGAGGGEFFFFDKQLCLTFLTSKY